MKADYIIAMDRDNVSGLIPEEVIAEVRERTDIVQVIGQHVQRHIMAADHDDGVFNG